jgi:hypothetical protein
MQIKNDGTLSYCRWSSRESSQTNIVDTDPVQYFQTMGPAAIRRQLLAGQIPPACKSCHDMEKHGKVSGRQKQLLKIGVLSDHWHASMSSSDWLPIFKTSTGETDLLPVDWQIDLGNYCNSACVFCYPASSSRLANEWQKIGFINQVPKPAWIHNQAVFTAFLSQLKSSPNLKYLHFLGGETVLTPAFAKILEVLIQHNLASQVTVGFTTNLTVWPENVVLWLESFQQVHVGLSLECIDTLNDYVRFPSQLSQVISVAEKWIELAHRKKWLVQLRSTPTVLTVHKLLTVYDFAMDHAVSVESCNFLRDPDFMRVSLLPMHLREPIIQDMTVWLDNHGWQSKTALEINARNPNKLTEVICQDLASYRNYLATEPEQLDKWPALIEFVKKLDQSRQNCILDYLPEYESIFRSYGY